MFTFKDDEMRAEALSMLTYVFLLFLIKREYIMCVRFYQRQTIYTSLNYYNTKCTNYTIIWCVFFDNETV